MKVFNDKKYNKIFKYCFAFVMLTLVIIVVIFQWDIVKSLVSSISHIFSPVIWGMVIAFIMNPIMKKTEGFLNRRVFKKRPAPRVARAIGVVCASVIFIAAIAAIILSVIPELISNIPGIYDGLMNEALPQAESWIVKILDDNPSIANVVTSQLDELTRNLGQLINGLVPQLRNLLTSVLDFANSVKNFFFGFILAIYFLFSKELLQAQAKRIIVALFSEKTYHSIFSITSNTNHAFLSFIYGKILDSLLIGLLCGLFMMIFKMPYAMLIAIIIGTTNIIPVFGPFIGAIPSAVLVLIADPGKVIWFILFIIALQQLDANVIEPKILGNKIGLSSFWVLFAILICGGLFGVVGMIIGVPLFAVIFDTINSIVETRLRRKNMPTDNSYYSMPGVSIGSADSGEDALPDGLEDSDS
mgnify:CR=1 FL=1